ncbi:MAG: mannose-1-phosphate guanylyltransferase [Candidatus Brocadiales bacterium]|nr:mannose-1-phosphate guanylyltransferase [Candidatus Brocadiales bacterium]
MTNARYAVIMAGGSGTRFWPWSREDTPKQLLKIVGQKSMLQHTIDRITPLFKPENILIVTNISHKEKIQKQVPQIPPANVVAEPMGKDTAPCIGLAATIIHKRSPDAVMIVMTADHVIEPASRFVKMAETAMNIAGENNSLLTMGIKPTEPSVSYGYIHRGKHLLEESGFNVYEVESFKEKPDKATAQHFINTGEYYWNGGIFVWQTAKILECITKYTPKLALGLQKIGAALGTEFEWTTLEKEYKTFEKISIDYAVMEKAKDVVVIEVDFTWDDVGSWSALERWNKKDTSGNTILGNHFGIDTDSCIIVNNEQHLIATIGVSDMIVVHTKDATLICNKQKAEQIKKLVEELKQAGYQPYL